MARKPSQKTAKSPSANDLDLDLDDFSMDDLEAQISQAAEDLAAEERRSNGTAPASKASELQKPATARTDEPPRPVTATSSTGTVIPKPANDPATSLRGLVASFNKRPSSTVYWVALILSGLWIAGFAAWAWTVYGADLAAVTSVAALSARPYVAGLAAGLLFPVALIWSFAVMTRRAQEMRLAAQSMTEVAYRLVEPESLAEDRLMSISQAVRREVDAMGEGIERTLSRAVELETLVHTEVNELERAYTDNETRIRSLIDSLGGEREAVITHAERLRQSITGSREELLEELSRMADSIRDTVTTASTEMSMTLNLSGEGLAALISESGEGINRALDEKASKVSALMTTSGEAFANLLDTRVSKLNDTTERVAGTIAGLLDDRTTGMVTLLTDATRALAEQFDNRLEGLESTLAGHGNRLISEFETRSAAIAENTDRLNAALDARARQINDTLADRTREIAETFNSGRSGVVEAIDNGRQALEAELAAFTTAASTSVDETTDRFRDRIRTAREELDISLSGSLGGIGDALTAHREAIAGHASGFAASAMQAAGQVGEALAERAMELEMAFGTGAGRIEMAAENAAASVNDAIGASAGRIEAATVSAAGRITAVIDEKSSLLDQTIGAGSGRLAETLDSHRAAIADLLDGRSAEIDGNLAARLSDIDATLSARSLEIDSAVSGHAERIERSLADKIELVDRTLSSHAGRIDETLAARIAEADRNLAGHADRVGTVLSAQADEIAGRFSSSADRAIEAISSRANDVMAQAGAMEEALARGGEGVRGLLEGVSHRIAEDLRGSVRVATRDLIAESEKAADLIGRSNGELSERLETVLAKTGEALSNRAGNIEQQLAGIEAAFENADQRILARTHQTSAELDARVRNVVETIQELEGRIFAKFGDAETGLSGKGREFLARLEDIMGRIDVTGDETRSLLERKADELNASLAERSSEIARILDETGRPLAERLEGGAEKLAATLRNEAEAAATRLRAETETLADAIAASSERSFERMSGLRNSLAGEIADLIDRLSGSNVRLGQLVDDARSSLTQVDERLSATTETFADRTERAARQIDTAATLIDGKSGRLETLAGDTLSQIAGIANRFDDHGQMLGRAAELLQAAQSNLSSKLDQRAEAIEALAEGLIARSREVETVLGSFENLVATTFDRAEKRTNAAASGLSTTLREAVEEATSRFTSATSDMQQAAAAIREDLARTRDAVTRGTEDLPAQTRQTADTIQRAIGDQIDAIRELSGIVAKSAAGEARRPVEPRPAPRAATPEPAPRPAVAETGLRGLLQDEPRQPAKPRAEPETNDSYLAGLLRRASEQDYAGSRRPATPERSPNQVIESLNSLAVDIARAIDHDKAVELWGRYLRGEKDVFTHRLYTLRGQRTFDDISAKYRADREFRSVVDNYCDEFERLLRKVAKGDNAARETEKLLTTDNGKVYTMLAHAAGRLS